jgi:hypothetical protein
MEPELVREFAAEYHREFNRLNSGREAGRIRGKEELDRVDESIHYYLCLWIYGQLFQLLPT